MIRVVVVADSGSVFASLTAAVRTVPGAYIVRHASSSAPLNRVLESLDPDLVLIGDLLYPDDALARLAEVRRTAPGARVVLLSSSPEAGWLADALRAQASAVLPGQLEPRTLGQVLREVLATGTSVVPFPERPAGVQPAAGAAA
jgi:DNA-binding NarL/FixJ family response regulator